MTKPSDAELELAQSTRRAERAFELVASLAQFPDGLSHRKLQELTIGSRGDRIAIIDVAIAEGWIDTTEKKARGGTQQVHTVSELGRRVLQLGPAARQLEENDVARRIIDQRLAELAALERQIYDERNALLESRRQIKD